MHHKLKITLLGLSTILLLCQCGNEKEETTKNNTPNAVTDTASTNTVKEPELPVVKEIHYTAYPLKGMDTAVKHFKSVYNAQQQYLILALNRLDGKHISRADTLIIPDTLTTDLMFYSPYPAYVEALKDIPKIIFFSYPIQAFGAYENGQLTYWGPTSMGSKIHQTPVGLHFTNWKGKQIISTVNDEWKLNWNFNIANYGGVGWHEYDLPGYPASHSCLRLLADQAKYLYDWGEQWILDKNGSLLANGTPVIVFGEYPWGQRRPWKELLDNPKSNTITDKDLTDLVNPFMEKIMQAQTTRAAVLQNKDVTATSTTDTTSNTSAVQ